MARHGENIRKRKDGRWEARVICGYTEDGRAKYKYIYRKTYTEAKEAKNQMIAHKLTDHTGRRHLEICWQTGFILSAGISRNPLIPGIRQ